MRKLILSSPLETEKADETTIHIYLKEGFFGDMMLIYAQDQLINKGTISYFNWKGGEELNIGGQRFTVKWIYDIMKGGLPKSLIIEEENEIIAQYGNDSAKRLPINGGLSPQLSPFAWVTAGACVFTSIIHLCLMAANARSLFTYEAVIPLLFGLITAFATLMITTDIERSKTSKLLFASPIVIICWIVYISFAILPVL